PWRNLAGDLIRIRLKFVFLGQLEWHRHTAKAKRDRWISWKTRVWIKHFIARIDQRHHRHEQCDFASGSDDDAFRRDAYVASAIQIPSEFLAQRRNPGHGTVTVSAFIHRFFQRLIDHRGRMKIRLSELKMDDRLPFTLQFLSARINRERALSTHYRHARRQPTHQILLGGGVTGMRRPSTKRGKNSKIEAVAINSTIA